MQGIRYAKYTPGNATNPSFAPNAVNGIIVSTVIPVNVSNVRGTVARLWINGIFGVRIIWITSVWLHMEGIRKKVLYSSIE